MAYDCALYMHDLDRKAFDALNMFPQLLKLQEAYIANVDEKSAKLEFLANAIRLNENQKPDTYNLLPPICDKLGIEVPDLYMIQSRNMKDLNAFTGGVQTPYICVTSELLKQLPPPLVASIIAHECGHISCRHYLYHSLARNFLNGIKASPLYKIPAIRKQLSISLISSLLFWDRCSELSADRAAVLCDEDAGKTIDALLRIHGFEQDINRDEFIKQALDLKAFVNDSEANKMMEQMIVQWDSHPMLATRAYECYDWAQTDRFKGILGGTVTKEQAEEEDEKTEEDEVLAAVVEATGSRSSGSMKDAPPELEAALNQRLRELDAEIERYTNHADKEDYALAIASGILSGILDSVLFSDTSIFSDDLARSHESINRFIQKYAKDRELTDERIRTPLKRAVEKLEKAFPVAQDNIWKGVIDGVNANNHHLADLAHHPTPLGLLAAIAVKFMRVGVFVTKDGNWSIQIVKIKDYEKKDLSAILVSAVITGVMNWLVNITESRYEESAGRELPKAIRKLAHVVASTPMLVEIFKCADNWFGHLVSDMGGSRTSAEKSGGMGIPGVFLSLFYELASLPILKDTGLLEVLNDLYMNHKFDIRHELALGNQVKMQAISVAFNEIYVRTSYMLGTLVDEISKHEGFKRINWRRVIPIANRTVDRMMAVASMTFNVVDTGDAAVRAAFAAVESGGNWVVFSGKFVARYNYVGAGRAALAIVREFSNEKKEAQLIHERMILMEAKAEMMFGQLQDFKEKLNEKLTEYLAEDIEAFMEGFDDINEGLRSNNSDLVIKGNVTIQRVLGRAPQFTTQEEFDDLMESDIPLLL